jgi:hypothetical protein
MPTRAAPAAEVLRDGDIRPSPRPAPAAGLLARRRIAIARFGADVAAAGGIGPALAAGLDPGDYPVVPGGVPQAWERAQLYLGLCERYQDLYQVKVAELHILMATVPECSLPLSHRRPLTGPLTDTHTGYISLNTARLRRRPQHCVTAHIGGSRALATTSDHDAALPSVKSVSGLPNSAWTSSAYAPLGL